jgi:hypothetical protein
MTDAFGGQRSCGSLLAHQNTCQSIGQSSNKIQQLNIYSPVISISNLFKKQQQSKLHEQDTINAYLRYSGTLFGQHTECAILPLILTSTQRVNCSGEALTEQVGLFGSALAKTNTGNKNYAFVLLTL